VRRRIPLLVGVIAILAIGAALAFAPKTGTATGVVVGVDSVSISDVRGFRIREAGGRTIEFALGVLENGAQFSPGHLVEHIASGVPVVVSYRDERGTLTAYRLEDAPVPSPT
jgi:hypothetical protein